MLKLRSKYYNSHLQDLKLTLYQRTIFGNIVFVFVGPSQAKFGIHEGLLQRASSLFKAAIVGGPIPESDIESSCQEDGAKALWLRNEDPVIFKRLNDWLYTGRVTTTGEKCKDLSWSLLIDIYIFGERRNIPAFQNTCVNTVIQKCNDGAPFPGQATVNTLWNNQGDVWPLQRLILHLFAAKCDLKAALMKNSGYPQRFLHDLVIILYESKVKPETDVGDDFWAIRKNYHVHKSENPITID